MSVTSHGGRYSYSNHGGRNAPAAIRGGHAVENCYTKDCAYATVSAAMLFTRNSPSEAKGARGNMVSFLPGIISHGITAFQILWTCSLHLLYHLHFFRADIRASDDQNSRLFLDPRWFELALRRPLKHSQDDFMMIRRRLTADSCRPKYGCYLSAL